MEQTLPVQLVWTVPASLRMVNIAIVPMADSITIIPTNVVSPLIWPALVFVLNMIQFAVTALLIKMGNAVSLV